MTGYAAGTADLARGRLTVELRSVNSRYLDVQCRIAEELRAAEPALRELIASRVARGKIDCRVAFGAHAAPASAASLDAAALENLQRLAAEARRAFPEATPMQIGDVLRWPGIVAETRSIRGCAGALELRARSSRTVRDAHARRRKARAIRLRASTKCAAVRRIAPLVPRRLPPTRQSSATLARRRSARRTPSEFAPRSPSAMRSDADETDAPRRISTKCRR
jgi:uncharacterized protein YicC (UPF0701 family)